MERIEIQAGLSLIDSEGPAFPSRLRNKPIPKAMALQCAYPTRLIKAAREVPDLMTVADVSDFLRVRQRTLYGYSVFQNCNSQAGYPGNKNR
jgi:hypothetical protein